MAKSKLNFQFSEKRSLNKVKFKENETNGTSIHLNDIKHKTNTHKKTEQIYPKSNQNIGLEIYIL